MRWFLQQSYMCLLMAGVALALEMAASADATGGRPAGVWPLADHNADGDVLLATSKKWLLNWKGVLKAERLPAEFFSARGGGQRISPRISGGLYPRDAAPTLSLFPLFRISAVQTGAVPVPAAQFPDQTPVLGWLCSEGGLVALVQDKRADFDDASAPVVGLFAAVGMVTAHLQKENLFLGDCALTVPVGARDVTSVQDDTSRSNPAGLVALVRGASSTWLWNARSLFPKSGLPFPAARVVSVFSLEDSATVWPFDPVSGRIFSVTFDVEAQTPGVEPLPAVELSVGLPARGPVSDASDNDRVVSRNGQILYARWGQIWLGKAGALSTQAGITAAPASSQPPLSWQRLPLAPCEETNPGGCALSLGHDGTWAVSGYWGTFAGLSGLFRRLVQPNFSALGRPLALSHQSVPGHFGVLGADDADLGFWSEPLDLPAFRCSRCTSGEDDRVEMPDTPFRTRHAKLKGVDRLPIIGVAWLRPGVEPVSHQVTAESPLFRDQWGLQVVEVAGGAGFDPERHLFFEPVLETGPLIPKVFNWSGRPGGQSDAKSPRRAAVLPLWWMSALGYDEAWDLVAGQEPLRQVRVVLLDSGADLAHPGFHPIYPGDEIPGNGLDDDGNGYVDDAAGYDFVDEDATPQDEHGHGSHVAGLLFPDHPLFERSLELMVVRVLDRFGRSNTLDIGRGFIYAADRGADVINASWGGGGRTQFMEEAIRYAQGRGAVVVTSAGNDGLNIDREPPVPAVYPGVLAIGARQTSGRRASFSNYGSERVFTFMPGADIPSLALGGGLTEKSGTSMAAPLFSSFLAVALSYLPGRLNAPGPASERLEQVLEVMCTHPAAFAQPLASRCKEPSVPQTLQSLLADSGLQVIRFGSRRTAERGTAWQN